jgi:hypothetical protein
MRVTVKQLAAAHACGSWNLREAAAAAAAAVFDLLQSWPIFANFSLSRSKLAHNVSKTNYSGECLRKNAETLQENIPLFKQIKEAFNCCCCCCRGCCHKHLCPILRPNF